MSGAAAMRRRILVIYNPTAGGRGRRRFKRTLHRLRRLGCELRVAATTQPGDAERLARSADPGAVDVVVAAGGDGTVNEVANGLGDGAVPLAVLPLGTANVLAAEIGLGTAPGRIAAAITRGPLRNVYPGLAEGRRFLMFAGIGFDARAVARVRPRLKRRLGRLAYLVAGVEVLLAARPAGYEVEIDGVSYRAAGVIVANASHYAGRYRLVAAARLTEPCFRVCLFARGGSMWVLRYALALILGRLERLGQVRVVTGRRVAVAGPAGDPVQLDGDLGPRLPVSIRSTGRPLRLAWPAEG